MALPASLTDIANLSLDLIGDKTINDINNIKDPIAQLMKRQMDTTIKEVQTMVHWPELYSGDPNDISEALTLESITDTYVGVDGQYQFILPADFLAVLETNSFPPNTLPGQQDSRFTSSPVWKLQNGFLIARVENFQLLYKRLDRNPAKWTSELTEMIYVALADKIVINRTQNRQLADFIKQRYMEVKGRVLTTSQNRARSRRTRDRRFSYTTQLRSNNPNTPFGIWF